MQIQTKTTWRIMKFKDFADTSPSVKLERGKEYPFIPMDVVDGRRKFPVEIKRKNFSGGGAKFANGDTIFARITPCLENGKIVKIQGLKEGVGFGSTEFFVFRGKDGISDSDFVYYLSRTDTIRDPAVKSMGGASGRQRANKTVVDSVQVTAPDLSQQKQIASVLSTYDNLIENNNRRIQILEQMAQAIYTEWFVKFRFPGYEKVKMIDSRSDFEKIPEGWEVKKIGEIFSVKYGKNLPKTITTESGKFPVYGAGGVIGFYSEKNIDDKTALITSRGNGSGTVWRTKGAGFVTNNSFTIIGKDKYSYFSMGLIYNLLLNANIRSSISGSAQPQVTINSLDYVEILVPEKSIAEKFQNEATYLYDLCDRLFTINQNLRQTRDLLLPKLVTGEIEVQSELIPKNELISFLNKLFEKTKDNRLADDKVKSRIVEMMSEACEITELSFSDLLQRLDFKPSDLNIEALESFLAELRSIFWLRDFGFVSIEPLEALKKSVCPDFTAKYGGKTCCIEVFCLTQTHGQKKDSNLGVYVNFDPQFTGSKFGRDFISKANLKKKQLDSGDKDSKILLCVLNSDPVILLNTADEIKNHAKFLYEQLNWGNGYYVGILTGVEVNGVSSNTIFPSL